MRQKQCEEGAAAHATERAVLEQLLLLLLLCQLNGFGRVRPKVKPKSNGAGAVHDCPPGSELGQRSTIVLAGKSGRPIEEMVGADLIYRLERHRDVGFFHCNLCGALWLVSS